MKHAFTYILLLTQYLLVAQKSDTQTYALSIDSVGIWKHVMVLNSDSLENRIIASEGQRKAANYIETYFKKAGLLAGWNGHYQQNFPVYQDSLNRATLAVNNVPLKKDTDYIVTNNSGFNVSFAASEVLFVGYGLSDSTRDDYKDVNARGKIVMVFPGAGFKMVKGKKIKDKVPDHYTLQLAAQKNGAIALLITDKKFPRSPSVDKGEIYLTDRNKEGIPNTFIISDSVGRKIMGTDYYIAQKIMKINPPPPKSCYLSVMLELDKITERLESSNVMGLVEGTDKKEEVVIVWGAYDSTNNVYGTSALMEVAAAFSKATAHTKPRRTVLFMATSYFNYYLQNPTFPLDKIVASININEIINSGSDQLIDDSRDIFNKVWEATNKD